MAVTGLTLNLVGNVTFDFQVFTPEIFDSLLTVILGCQGNSIDYLFKQQTYRKAKGISRLALHTSPDIIRAISAWIAA